MLTVLIPCKNEPYLEQTIQEVLTKAHGEVEVLTHEDTGETNGMRKGINEMATRAKGKYLLKLDAHCMLADGYDIALIEAHQENWVQTPRRKRLDVEKWEVIEDGREDIDYESILFPPLVEKTEGLDTGFIWATPWDDLTRERKDVLIDDTPHFQGSCWFMTKDWFHKCGFMSDEYGGFAQEPEEITFKTLQVGGKVKVNKNTWYAHWHKSEEDRKLFKLDSKDMAKGYEYSYKTWVRNRAFFEPFINSFPPMPGWPTNWQKILWN